MKLEEKVTVNKTFDQYNRYLIIYIHINDDVCSFFIPISPSLLSIIALYIINTPEQNLVCQFASDLPI